jgi:tRNA(Ile)-lysidine synthase TilS/MesJ
MMDLDERMLEEYANLNDLVRVEKSCPHENRTQRENVAQLLRQVENLHGKGLFNIFKSMDKIFEEFLPVRH